MPYESRKPSKYDENEERSTPLTTGDLRFILETNKKSIEIYLEVEKQNEEVLKKLESLSEDIDKIVTHEKNIDKNFFKLVVLLGTIGVGTIIAGLKILFGGH